MKDRYFELSNLSVGYNRKTLIDDICLDIKKGEIVTLIGPNGAGKSTILKSITRQLEIIRGKVFIEEGDLMKISYKDLSKKMAVVLTERLKTELLTCHDIVATGRYPYTGRLGILSHEDEDKVDAALALVNARELGNKDFNAISDGQRQRVLMARAICQEPDIIILDEPTSFLDIHYKLELLSILARMAKQNGITIIMTLHEIDLAQKISDKIVCVSEDHVVHYGTPAEIFEEEVIRDLYGIDNGFYDPLFGSIELAKPEGGKPEVFVISSGGTGIPVYRELQKTNTPFASGILYTNDLDYQLARLLSEEVVCEEPFEDISDRAYVRAKELVDLCDRVVYTGFRIGTSNRRVGEIVQYAKELGKLE
jgi:iron complex transport system ATP-binding protein